MITEYIRYRLPAGDGAAFEAAYTDAARALARSPHCVDFDLSRCVDDTGQYILRIRWDSAEGHLQGFRRSAEFADFIQAVRSYVPAIEEMRHYAVTPVAGQGGAVPRPPTLYEWAGGIDRLHALVDTFYARVKDDAVLQPVFGTMSPEHPRHVAAWLAEVMGGPADYSARLGGHPNMLRHHLRRQITEAQRRRWVDLLVDAADDVGLPDDAEFRASFMAYVEWGTRLAKAFSQPGANPVFDEPVPRWDWVRPPWQGD